MQVAALRDEMKHERVLDGLITTVLSEMNTIKEMHRVKSKHS